MALLRRKFPESLKSEHINIKLYRDKSIEARDRRRIKIAVGLLTGGILTFIFGLVNELLRSGKLYDNVMLIFSIGILMVATSVILLWMIRNRLSLGMDLNLPSGWARLKNVHPNGFAKLLDLEQQRNSTSPRTQPG